MPSAVVVWIGTKSVANFERSLSGGVWGFDSPRPKLSPLQTGDLVVFGEGFSLGQPRVDLNTWLRGTLARLVIGRVTRPMYESSDPFWPDDVYPQRFNFQVVGQVTNVPLGDPRLPESVSDGLRPVGTSTGRLVRLGDTDASALLGLVGAAPGGSEEPPEPEDLGDAFVRVLELQADWHRDNTPAMKERGELVRDAIPRVLRSRVNAPSDGALKDLEVEGRDGTGLKTRVPWVRLFSKSRSPKPTDGWYVVYLFSFDGSRVYLSLNQGTTVFEGGDFKPKPPGGLVELADSARGLLTERGLWSPGDGSGFEQKMTLADVGQLGAGYETANVCAAEYSIDAMPSNDKLVGDLEHALRLLDAVYELDDSPPPVPPVPPEPPTPQVQRARTELTLELVRKHTNEAGLVLDDSILAAAVAALRSGKDVVFTGPPGTAKTTLAEAIAAAAAEAGHCDGHLLTTATSDWTTFETIGGLRPTIDGELRFSDGQFLTAIRQNHWLVVDEMNRSNFDRAFGQLFTVLSGQSVTLPYQGESTLPIRIARTGSPESLSAEHEVVTVPTDWRLIGTMNVFDKSLLFEMSFALMRRFAFIEVPAPSESVYRTLITKCADGDREAADATAALLPLRKVKEVGPALFMDMAKFASHRRALGEVSESELTYQLFYSYLLPQFEGIDDRDAGLLVSLVKPLLDASGLKRLRRDLHDVLGVEPRAIKAALADDPDEQLDDIDGGE